MKKAIMILGFFGILSTSSFYAYRIFFVQNKSVDKKAEIWVDRIESFQNQTDI
ncbi:MAG: hypothetical protein RL108_2082, partial [Bacteroidota bacterium]